MGRRNTVLSSMTGFGVAQQENAATLCTVEARSVNNRFLKVQIRLPDQCAELEHQIEQKVRQSVERGTVTLSVRFESLATAASFAIKRDVLEQYLSQLRGVVEIDGSLVGRLLTLPGVVESGRRRSDPEADAALIHSAVDAAVSAMQTMRREEGRAMRQELTALCGQARECVDAVESHRPAIVAAHRDRLHHRVSSLLADLGVTLSPADLLREAAILADRSDVAE
ncbi:MAG: YicC/YloC family endoribonuclease, partial [Planctomycetia bacterium]